MSMSDGDGETNSPLPNLDPHRPEDAGLNLPPVLDPPTKVPVTIPSVFFQICRWDESDWEDNSIPDSDSEADEDDEEDDDDFDYTDRHEDVDVDEDDEDWEPAFFDDPTPLSLFEEIINLFQPPNQDDIEALTSTLSHSYTGYAQDVADMLSQKYDHPDPPNIASAVGILEEFSCQYPDGLNNTDGGALLLHIVTYLIQRHFPQLCASQPDWPLLLTTSQFGIKILNNLSDDTLKYIGRRQPTIMGIMDRIQQGIIKTDPAYELRHLLDFLFTRLRPFARANDPILPFATMYKAIAHHVSLRTPTSPSNQASPQPINPTPPNPPQDDSALGMSDHDPSQNCEDRVLSFAEDSKHLQPHINCPTLNYASSFDPDFYWFRYALTKYSSIKQDAANEIFFSSSQKARPEMAADQLVMNRLALSYDEHSYYQLKESLNFTPTINIAPLCAPIMKAGHAAGGAQTEPDIDPCKCGNEPCDGNNDDCTCLCLRCISPRLREAHARDDVPPNKSSNKDPPNLIVHPLAVNRFRPPLLLTQAAIFPESLYLQLPNLTSNHPIFQSRGYSSRAMQVQDAVDSAEFQHFFVGSFLLGNNIMSTLHNAMSSQTTPLCLFDNLQQLLTNLHPMASICPALSYQLRLLQCRIHLLPSMRREPIPRSAFVRLNAWPAPNQRMPSSLDPLFYLHLGQIPPNLRYRPIGLTSDAKGREAVRRNLLASICTNQQRWHALTHFLLEELSGQFDPTSHFTSTLIANSWDLYSINRATLHQHLYHELQTHPAKTKAILNLLLSPFLFGNTDTNFAKTIHQHIILCAHAGMLNPTNVVDTPLTSSPNRTPMNKPSPNQIQALLHTQRELTPLKAVVYSYLMKQTGLHMVFPTPYGETGALLLQFAQATHSSRIGDITDDLKTQWHRCEDFGRSSADQLDCLSKVPNPLKSLLTPSLTTYSHLVVDDSGNILFADQDRPSKLYYSQPLYQPGKSQQRWGELSPIPANTTKGLPLISILPLSQPFAQLNRWDITAEHTHARYVGNPTSPLKDDLDYQAYRKDAIEAAQLLTTTHWTQEQTDLVTDLLTDDVLWDHRQTGQLPDQICVGTHTNAVDQPDTHQSSVRDLPHQILPFLESNRPQMKVRYEHEYPNRFDHPRYAAEMELIASSENVKLLNSNELLDIQQRYKTYLGLLCAQEEKAVTRYIVKVLKTADTKGIFNAPAPTTSPTPSTRTPCHSSGGTFPTLPTYPFPSPPATVASKPIAKWSLEMLLVCTLNLQPHQAYIPERFYQSPLPSNTVAGAPAPTIIPSATSPPLDAKVNAFLARPVQHQLAAHVAHIQPYPLSVRQKTWPTDSFPLLFESFLHYILEPVLQTRKLLIPLLSSPPPVPAFPALQAPQKRPRQPNSSNPL